MTTVTIRAPAKLNLGLEILRRRPDGYHDLLTIFQAVSIQDTLTLSPSNDLRLTASNPSLVTDDNLALEALRRLRMSLNTTQGASLHLDKQIPIAAGLGGASSDASAALVAARALWQAAAPDSLLADMAAGIGSDVPFFLRAGTALAAARGDQLTPLPLPPQTKFVIVTPNILIPRKTPTLYAALTSADFSAGAAVLAQADRLRAGLSLDPALLPNPFLRPLTALHPTLGTIASAMREAGVSVVALSGAGPTHYTVAPDTATAAALADDLRDRLGNVARIFVCEPVDKPPIPESS